LIDAEDEEFDEFEYIINGIVVLSDFIRLTMFRHD